MGLKNLTKNIYFLPHEPEVDRPMLAYVKGDKFSLAVDAGYSKKHVQDFYRALRSCDLKEPDFTVITHWHYDHTFGLQCSGKNTDEVGRECASKVHKRYH